MEILRTIKVKDKKFNPGQERQLLDHAAAFPEQLDFLWLLKSGSISEVPVVESLTPEQQEVRRKQIEDAEVERINRANIEEEERQRKVKEQIDQARQREVEMADKRRAALERADQQESGEGPE